MTIRQVELFVRVAECGKMNEVAKALYISQSSVSQAIAEIEQEYQVQLFERLAKRLYLTPVGQHFLEYAKRFLGIYEAMCQYLQETGDVKSIRVGATVTVGTCVINDILGDMNRTLPNLNIQVYVANTRMLEEMLINNELDVALVEGEIKNELLYVTPVIPDHLVLICGQGHPFWGCDEVSIKDLKDQALIMRERGSGTRAQLEEKLMENHITYYIKWVCFNTEAIKNAVICNEGVSIISARLVTKEVQEKKLWICRLRDFSGQRSFDIVYHRDKLLHHALEKFICSCQNFARSEWVVREEKEEKELS